jgi:putative membrane protein
VPEEALYDVPMTEMSIDRETLNSCRNVDLDSKMILGVKESILQAMVAKKLLLPNDTITRHGTSDEVKVSDLFKENTRIVDPWIVLCGMIAISAMLLPGISGSYMLQVLGVYALVLASLVDWVDGVKQGIFDWQAFRLLCSMGIGIIIGAISFSHLVRYLLRSKREIAVSCLVGFMLGSLKAVWPFWSYSYELIATHQKNGAQLVVIDPVLPQFFALETLLALTIFLFGIGAVLLIEHLAHQKNVRTRDTI